MMRTELRRTATTSAAAINRGIMAVPGGADGT
jgi:hypothetical protein